MVDRGLTWDLVLAHIHVIECIGRLVFKRGTGPSTGHVVMYWNAGWCSHWRDFKTTVVSSFVNQKKTILCYNNSMECKW